MVRPFKFLIYIIVCLVLLYSLYNIDCLKDKLGIHSPKMPVYDLNGYLYKNKVDIRKLTKPKIFIHLPLEKNERNWKEFGSRTSEKMNMSIVYLCIKSIIANCGHHYDVIIFDNENMVDMIDSYNLADDITGANYKSLDVYKLKSWENYCKMKILNEFGGAMMNPYFYFTKCPDKSILKPKKMTITKYVNEGLFNTNEKMVALPSHFVSSPKKDKDLNIYIQYLYHVLVNGEKFQNEKYENAIMNFKKLNIVDPKYFGIVSTDDEPIYYNDILSYNKKINYWSNSFAMYVNVEMFKTHTKDGWFLRLSPEQLINSNTVIGNYLKHHGEEA